MAIVLFQFCAQVKDILGRAGERSRNKVEALFHAKGEVLFIFFADERKREMRARDVDALMGGDVASVHNGADDVGIRTGVHAQFNQAIIDQNLRAGCHFLGQAREGDADDFVVAFHITGCQCKGLPFFQCDLFLGEVPRANFRTLGVQKERNRKI